VLSYIGDRSYSLYVSHVILFSGVYYSLHHRYLAHYPRWLEETPLGIGVQVLGLFVAAILLSEVSYQLIELPYIAYGKSVIKALRGAPVALPALDAAKLASTDLAAAPSEPPSNPERVAGLVEIAVSG